MVLKLHCLALERSEGNPSQGHGEGSGEVVSTPHDVLLHRDSTLSMLLALIEPLAGVPVAEMALSVWRSARKRRGVVERLTAKGRPAPRQGEEACGGEGATGRGEGQGNASVEIGKGLGLEDAES